MYIYACVLWRQLNEMHLSASDSKWVVPFRIISSSLATIYRKRMREKKMERRLQVRFDDYWMIGYSLIFFLFFFFLSVDRRKERKYSNDKNDSVCTITLHWLVLLPLPLSILLSRFLHQIVEYIHVLSSHSYAFTMYMCSHVNHYIY